MAKGRKHTARMQRVKAQRQQRIERKEAIDLHDIIDNVQDSLDRFQVMYEEGGDIVAAMLDLETNVGDLSDAVDKNESVE